MLDSGDSSWSCELVERTAGAFSENALGQVEPVTGEPVQGIRAMETDMLAGDVETIVQEYCGSVDREANRDRWNGEMRTIDV